MNIVDSHHKVLSAWATYRRTLEQPPRLITLDHHTDTSRPFRRWIAKVHGKDIAEHEFNRIQASQLEVVDFAEPRSIEESLLKLNNDEHIVTAIKTNIISSAFVIAHKAMNTDVQTFREHRIACRSVREIKGENGRFRPDHNSVLESAFLGEALEAFDEVLTQCQEAPLLTEPYILDIDLDYFNTFQSVSPENPQKFRSLAENAGLITVATEPEYVKTCALDPDLTSEYLLIKLKDLMREVV